jgi:hypothetical protein
MGDSAANDLAELEGALKEGREASAAWKKKYGSVTSPGEIGNFFRKWFSAWNRKPSKKDQEKIKQAFSKKLAPK